MVIVDRTATKTSIPKKLEAKVKATIRKWELKNKRKLGGSIQVAVGRPDNKMKFNW